MHKPREHKSASHVLSYARPRQQGQLAPTVESRVRLDLPTTILLVFGIILGAGILLSSFSPRSTHSHSQTPSQRCAYNMRQLFQTMRLYAYEHENKFPTNLAQIPRYLLKGGKGIPGTLVCPASSLTIHRSLTQA